MSYFCPCSDYLWGMVTYYCISLEEALRKAKAAGIPTRSENGHRGPKMRQMRHYNPASAAKSALKRRFRSWSELGYGL